MNCEYIPVDDEHPFIERTSDTVYYKQSFSGKTYEEYGKFVNKDIGPFVRGRTITWNFIASDKKKNNIRVYLDGFDNRDPDTIKITESTEKIFTCKPKEAPSQAVASERDEDDDDDSRPPPPRVSKAPQTDEEDDKSFDIYDIIDNSEISMNEGKINVSFDINEIKRKFYKYGTKRGGKSIKRKRNIKRKSRRRRSSRR